MTEGTSLKTPPGETSDVQNIGDIIIPKRRGRIVLTAGVLILLCGGLLAAGFATGLIGGSDESDDEIAKLKAAAKQTGDVDERKEKDRRFRQAIVGTWEMPEDGTYQMALRPDKTGTLVYLPNKKFYYLLAFTKRLEIEIKWELKDGHVDMWSISGTPERAFKIAIADRGKQKYFRIDELTDKSMVLFEIKKDKTDRWKKIEKLAAK